MLIQEVSRKYSQALFNAAKNRNLLGEADTQLKELGEIIKKDSSLMEFFSFPNVTDVSKIELVRSVFSERMNRLLVEFLVVLIEKKRINFLSEIIDDFIRLVEAERGIGRVTVISAVQLNNDERQKLIPAIQQRIGMDVLLEEKVDQSILGGMIVVMHNEIIDGSVRYGLEKIEDKLGKVRVL